MTTLSTAAEVVANELGKRPPAARMQFLRELMAHAAAGMVVIDGQMGAAESAYRLADAIVARRTRHG